MQKLIEVDKVTFKYENEPVLDEICFSVQKGDFLGIIGSNGTGKSTLLKLLLGELLPFSGTIRLFEEDVRQFKSWSKIGYLPQNAIAKNAGFPATAEEIVMANLFSEIGLFSFPQKKHREKVEKTLELVGMKHCANTLIGKLSGGQQQRVMLAKLLVAEPQIMLLDEPTSGVDAKTSQALYELLLKLNKETGLTIIMVTHDIAKAFNYVSRTLCLEEGSIVELDKKQINEELSHKHKHPVKSQIIFNLKESYNGNF